MACATYMALARSDRRKSRCAQRLPLRAAGTRGNSTIYCGCVWALQQCGGVRALIWLSHAALLPEGNTRQLALLRVLRWSEFFGVHSKCSFFFARSATSGGGGGASSPRTTRPSTRAFANRVSASGTAADELREAMSSVESSATEMRVGTNVALPEFAAVGRVADCCGCLSSLVGDEFPTRGSCILLSN
jgi:hypothetical protein